MRLSWLLVLVSSYVAADTTVKCKGSFADVMFYLGAAERPLIVSNVKLVVLLVHVASNGQHRNAHRRGWMNQTGVCPIDEERSMMMKRGVLTLDNCRVFYTFVLGNDNTPETTIAVAAESALHHDIVVLNQSVDPAPGKAGTNNMLKPKVMHMFEHVYHTFPWATHFAKMDIDAHPKLNLVLSALGHPQYTAMQQIEAREVYADWSDRNGGLYYGMTMNGRRGFQQGQLYALSRSLVECIVRTWVVHKQCRGSAGEDSTVGCLVHESSRVASCPKPVFLGSREVSTTILVRHHKKTTSNNFMDWNVLESNYTYVTDQAIDRFPNLYEAFQCT